MKRTNATKSWPIVGIMLSCWCVKTDVVSVRVLQKDRTDLLLLASWCGGCGGCGESSDVCVEEYLVDCFLKQYKIFSVRGVYG